jgi:hypothetical protein
VGGLEWYLLNYDLICRFSAFSTLPKSFMQYADFISIITSKFRTLVTALTVGSDPSVTVAKPRLLRLLRKVLL